ncbi:MAG: peptidylprolyl isomerase [Spirulinaceae cyanobacterium RM2_2_10]|nr:peptidylprolyl isomerase [Spirulinaceae cyanobacterium SM2_1_0]NJO19980.1 peptidylprolyl isomerase [Spirulinaceae cyanobacterium RM2_2_10]
MNAAQMFWQTWGRRLLRTVAIALLLVPLSLTLSAAWWDTGDSPARRSQLAQGNAVTDPTAILRNALPIENKSVRLLQARLEDISEGLRSKRWSLVTRDVKEAALVLNYDRSKILASVPADRQPQAETLLDQLSAGIVDLRASADDRDKSAVWKSRREMLNAITTLEELMVTGFPFEVPAEYADLPQLKGRATVKMITEKGDLYIVADGYNAPVNAGNFIDLVQRGFYDGLTFLPSQDYVLQTGDPPGEAVGFIDPDTGEYRAMPLEVKIADEEQPIYSITLENAGFYLAQPALPFSAYGTVALARPGDDPNGGSSQFFFFLFDTELTPPGFNLLDGRYSVFGYVVEGKETLENLKVGDKILSAEVVRGAENLVQPS